MNQTWLHQGRPVIVDIDTPKMPEYLPTGKHSLYVQIALSRLSWLPLLLPTAVTVGNLPWPVKAIVVPNDGQMPIWKTHRQHQRPELPESESLTPFVYADRTKKLPMTHMLTFELAEADTENFVITDVYPGTRIPPLPWQVSLTDDRLRVESMNFWRVNSFVYDSNLVASKNEYPAPNWASLERTISI
jgi:hypothetical protein